MNDVENLEPCVRRWFSRRHEWHLFSDPERAAVFGDRQTNIWWYCCHCEQFKASKGWLRD